MFLAVVVITVGVILLNSLFGNPISKLNAKKKYLGYFENTYHQTFAVYHSEYNPKIPAYIFEIGPESNKNIKFTTALYSMGISDEYGGILAAANLSEDVTELLKSDFGTISFKVSAKENPLTGYAGESPDYFETNPEIRVQKNHYVLTISWSDSAPNSATLSKTASAMEDLIEQRLPYQTPNLVVDISVTPASDSKAVSFEDHRLLFSTADAQDRKDVSNLVTQFGQKLKSVSLLAPADIVKASMQENYGDLVTPELLEKWQSDPQHAPGRLVSSPWPDRIEISSVKKVADGVYEVQGEIIEVTSAEQQSGKAAAKRPIALTVKKVSDGWRIGSVTMGPYVTNQAIEYSNPQYGFTFTLPEGWKNYSIISGKWEGYALDGAQSGNVTETGPIISIRHPQWTSQKPRQDIPIMIFTPDQWSKVKSEKLSVSAAPIPPSELGRNSKYVFALPARYNFAFPEGFEEVEKIIQGNPLHPNENIK